MKKISFILMSLFCVAATGAAEFLQPVSVDDLAGSVSDVKAIKGGFRINTQNRNFKLGSKKMIKIDPTKKYRVTCEMRQTPGKKSDGKLYFFIDSIDGANRSIVCDTVFAIPGSETVLAIHAKKGDKVIRVKDASKWKNKWSRVAFNAKADFADLPNFDLAVVTGIRQHGSVWELTLKEPLKNDYATGTALRNHSAGATYRYLWGAVKPGEQWTKLDTVIQGVCREYEAGYLKKWRPGVVNGRICFFINGSGIDVEIRNLKVVEIL
ncbi:MAG: hypothetical protein IKA87_06795 [Lentisphaeria bacterium]|nr:hypothetical protein [Lentisphaeria bacterium]